jgi:hypothetical protein
MKRMVFLVMGAMMMLVGQSRAQSSIPTAGLQLWLRADAGVDTLNGTVSRWHDQSGSGNDAIQASASRQPVLVVGALNGKPAVRFDGVNDKLGFTGTTHMTQFSLFLVLNNHAGTPGNDGNVITFGANGDFNHQWFMIMRFPNSSDSIALGPADNSYVNAFSHNVAAYDQWRNLSIVTTGSAFNTTLRWDGIAAHMSLDGSDQAISVPMGDATGSGGGIGGADGVPNGTILAKCDVAEMLVYNVALSDSARSSVERYLATKYGLQLSPPTAGLQLWLKADAGVDTLNGTVNRWHDQSGNGNDVIQASASRQPSLVADTLNHKPVIRFDGVNDKLGFTGTTHMTQFSLFLVIYNRSGSAGNVITFGAAGDFNNQWFMGMQIPSGPDNIGMLGNNAGIVAVGSGLAAYDQWRNISVVANQSIWSTTVRWDGKDAHMFPNGSGPAFSVPLGDATGSGGGIGGADGVPFGTILAKCDVAEVLVYNMALSDSIRKVIELNLATKYGLTITGISAPQKGSLPERYVLEQNYPNPFNPSTTIRYALPQRANVSLIVYNTLGQQVAALVNENQEAGSHEVHFDGSNLSSGVYFYRLHAGVFLEAKKFVLVR